ncbi:penicillin acylase family protein, partial [Escherichia coli]|nr:penicillin acylase family protein [Escherichia coli]
MKNRNRMIVNCVTASLMYYWSLPALAEQSSSEIKIVRDEYGMPHIYANDTWHLFYGYGYVVAQDRLFQMWICPYISRHLLSLNPLLA